jgi:hypothetical protein
MTSRLALLTLVGTLGCAAAAAQSERLRKSDLVRLLAGGAVSRAEIAELVERRCVSFTPTPRDRADLVSVGADSAIMSRIDECVRRAARAAAAAPRPAPRGPATPLPAAARPPAAAASTQPVRPVRVISPERTAFVSGGGQRGRVGTELPLPVVFEVRDTTNAPLVGQEVIFTATNARLSPDRARTDSAGQARVVVVLGPRAQPVSIRARTDALERQVSVLALPGPPARVVVRCGTETASGRIVVRSGAAARLEVTVHDAFGNELPVTGLRAAAGDRRLLRVERVEAQGQQGAIVLEPRQAGATNVAVFASGVRETVTATVSATGLPGCRQG